MLSAVNNISTFGNIKNETLVTDAAYRTALLMNASSVVGVVRFQHCFSSPSASEVGEAVLKTRSLLL